MFNVQNFLSHLTNLDDVCLSWLLAVIKAVLLAASSAHENCITIPLIALRAEQKPYCDVWGFDKTPIEAGRRTKMSTSRTKERFCT